MGLSVICVTSLYSQDQIMGLSYADANDINFFKSIKNNTRTLIYEFEDGNRMMVGDTIRLGDPTTEGSYSRTVGGGYRFAGVANSRTTTSKEFQHIILGKSAGFGNAILALNGQGPNRASVGFRGEQAIIVELILTHKGGRKKPLNVSALLGEINGKAFGINKYLTVTNIEDAWYDGEILLRNTKMTREQAIAKLKEAKDLVELEMMSKEDFEALKTELTPIIMGK
jgi:hypothetical protein